MASKHFQDLLKRMDAVHIAKNHDYADEKESPFSNFERAAIITSWFKTPIDQVFAAIIGIKIARLAELCNGKTPKNESIDDNGLDLANYAGLWQAFREYNRERTQLSPSSLSDSFYCDICKSQINDSIMHHVLITHPDASIHIKG